jgi:hypothetical protein
VFALEENCQFKHIISKEKRVNNNIFRKILPPAGLSSFASL